MANIYNCPSCEAKIKYKSNYCQNCGVKLEWENDESAEEDLLSLSEDEIVIAYGLNPAIPKSGSAKYGYAAAGGSLVAGWVVEEIIGIAARAYVDPVIELKLCHSKTRIYGIVPGIKHEVVDVSLDNISADYSPVSGSDFGDIIIKTPGRAKAYIFPNVYMPNLFYKSIKSAISGKFDKSIYQSGLKDLPKKTKPKTYEEESDGPFDEEFDDL